ncbi:MAG TPA: hypothetical protein VF071_07015 [Candidatus Limnocylindria bacterium]
MPDLLRRVAVLTIVSAIGIAALTPLTARSALPEATVPDRLLDAAEAPASSLHRAASDGRELSAALTLLAADAPIGPEDLGAEASAAARPSVPPMQATLYLKPTPPPTPKPPVVKPPPVNGNTITGRVSWYCHVVGTCPAGWGPGDAFVALPGALGGAGGRGIVGYVTVCGDRCVRLPVVDYCACYWGTASQRIADLSVAAWKAVSDTPTSAGIMRVTIHLEG